MSDNVGKKVASGLDVCVFYSFLFILLVAADQFIKKIIVNKISFGGQIDVINGFFSLYHVRNTGSAFSLFADKEWGIYFLTGISVVMGIVIFILMIIASRHGMKLIALAFCLLSSGAVGNLIDRFRLKYVVDYLRFDFGAYTFPIFNFADICAVVGTILLIGIILLASGYFETFWNIIFKKKVKAEAETEAEEKETEENAE